MSSPIEQGNLRKDDGGEDPSDYIVRTAEFIPVDSYKRYVIAFKGVPYVGVHTFDSNKAQISDSDWQQNNYIFSVENNCKYVRFVFKIGSTKITPSDVSNIMLTTDLNATYDDFVPYSGYDIKTIGTNLLNPTLRTVTRDGITCAYNDDGTYMLNGTCTTDDASSKTVFTVFKKNIKIDEDVKFICCASSGSGDTFRASVDYDDGAYSVDYGEGVMLNKGKTMTGVNIVISKGVTVSNLVFKPMLTTDPNATYDDFVPYTESTAHIDSSTEFPNFDLKTFDGATHIISPGNVQSFHANAPNGKYLLESIKKSAESGGVSYGSTEPTNPKVGDLWVNPDQSDVLQVYNGEYWGGINGLYIGDGGSFPSSPYPGQLVYNPRNKMMYVYISYGGSWGDPGWLAVGSEDPGGYHFGATAPTNTKLLWIDTSGVARFYNGSAWAPLTPTWG